MTGLMMDYPLTLTHILERSARIYPRKEIASRVPDGSMHRYTYSDFHQRVHRLAHALGAWESKRAIASGRCAGTVRAIWSCILQFHAPAACCIL